MIFGSYPQCVQIDSAPTISARRQTAVRGAQSECWRNHTSRA
jgi:hypothetical protein